MLIQQGTYAFPTDPKEYASSFAPSLEEWEKLWHLWDTVTRKMIPTEELMEKPIKLRNACIFYLGHIPTFLDMKLAETTDGNYTEPTYFPKIFERGIDPDVDNPDHCHDHSEVPDSWPPLDVILSHQQRVRERVKTLFAEGKDGDPKVARCLWLGYEHEAMHLETLLYMLVQSDKTLSPPGIEIREFLAAAEGVPAIDSQWFDIPAQTIKINMDDPETEKGLRYFGWDVEKPSRLVPVHAIQAKAGPITNGEYANYLFHEKKKDIPASWVLSDPKDPKKDADSRVSDLFRQFLANKAVRTVFGHVPLESALDWPVSASYDELAGCASYIGGRIPTLEEVNSIYAYAERRKEEEIAAQVPGETIPAVNSHLLNDGVQESPPLSDGCLGGSPTQSLPGERERKDLFADLQGMNVGFQQWTPCRVGSELQGRGGMGGLWEWTSSILEKHEGYEPMKLYEAYSRDFFDDKHNIVLGGSWATVPRIAGRKSFINWYQRNYPFVWAGARVVRDI